MGRSRGGLTTKIHAVVDANGSAVSLKLSEGQAHDGRSAADMLDTTGEGQILLADRAYVFAQAPRPGHGSAQAVGVVSLTAT